MAKSRPAHGHANGFVPIKAMKPGDSAWNLSSCDCGAVKDARASICRGCFTTISATKDCPGCDRELPRSDFYSRSSGELIPRCKQCTNSRRSPRRTLYKIRSRAKRLKSDLNFRIYFNLSASVRIAVKKVGARKSARAEDLLGCSIQDFRRHIEALWLPGMTWSNWGRNDDEWQLDHIRPIASFDLTDPAQQVVCFHFSNYQPLWAPDNRRKGSTYLQPKENDL
jgi:hypothetical protein